MDADISEGDPPPLEYLAAAFFMAAAGCFALLRWWVLEPASKSGSPRAMIIATGVASKAVYLPFLLFVALALIEHYWGLPGEFAKLALLALFVTPWATLAYGWQAVQEAIYEHALQTDTDSLALEPSDDSTSATRDEPLDPVEKPVDDD